MGNNAKGVVSFEAGDDLWNLVFDFNAMCEIEDEFDMPVAEIGAKTAWRAKEIRSLFRIGLSRHHADVSDQEAGNIITKVGAKRAGELIGEAFQAANPPKEAAGGKTRPRAGASTS